MRKRAGVRGATDGALACEPIEEGIIRKFAWIAVVALVLVVWPVAADEHEKGPITWLAFSKVKPGKTEDAVKHTLDDDGLADRLMADGTILSWGLGTPINHNPGDEWNHVQWVTVADWSKIEAWAGALFESEGHEDVVLMVLHSAAAETEGN